MLCSTARVTKHAYRPLRCQPQTYFLRPKSTFTAHNRANILPNNASQEPRTAEKQNGTSSINLADLYPSTRTAHIRFWEPILNVADVWVVKRAMEKKYGSILETYFLKDFESPDRYQMIAFLIFRDLESLGRIPEAGEEFTILAPEVPKKPIHEIGVKDIEKYAGSEELQLGFQFDHLDSDTTKRVIGGKITRFPTEYASSPVQRKFFQKTQRKTMDYFLNWGGFNPVDTSQQANVLELFKPDAQRKNARMRAALQMCSRILSFSPLPQGITSTNTTSENQTVPKPGPSLHTARVFAGLYDQMSAPALGRLRKEAVDEEVESSVGETIDSTSSGAAVSEAPDENPTSPVDSSSLPSSIPPPIPSRPIKRPPMSPEEKQKLKTQLHAAKLLQQLTKPARRKQVKPNVIEPAKKSKPLDQAHSPLVTDKKQEKTGFLAKLASLFGR